MKTGALLISLVPLLWMTDARAQTPEQKTRLEKSVGSIKKLASDEAVVKAVRAHNTQKMTAEQVQKLDKEWMASKGATEFMRPFLEKNPCSDALKKFRQELPAVAEAFVMDDQGALVCATNKTSDYWQGDEDKWKKSFNGGKGATFIDKPTFDESSQSYVVQVSVPVMDGTRVIGAITVGLMLEKL